LLTTPTLRLGSATGAGTWTVAALRTLVRG
jgi:hypothetical protein